MKQSQQPNPPTPTLPTKKRRPRGVCFFDEIVTNDEFGSYFDYRLRVGAQRLGGDRYRVYVVSGFHDSWSQEAEGAEGFLAAYQEAAAHAGGDWEADIEYDLSDVNRLCPKLAGQIADLLDIEIDDGGPVLAGRPVNLFGRKSGDLIQLYRSDRGSWRLVATEEGVQDSVSRRIWSAAELGAEWYDLSPIYLLPRLQEVADRLRRRDPVLAEASFHLDQAWDAAPKVVDVHGMEHRPSWSEFVKMDLGGEG